MPEVTQQVSGYILTMNPVFHLLSKNALLTAIYCPKEVAVMHCKGHSRDGSKVAEDNQLADCQARKAALYETPSPQTPLDRFCGTGKTTILRKN